MTSIRKFLFDDSFDFDNPHGSGPRGRPKAQAEPEPAPAPPPPTFTEEELNATAADAFAQGEAAGRQAGYTQGFSDGHAAGVQEGMAQGVAQTEATVAGVSATALEHIAVSVGQLIQERLDSDVARRDEPIHIAMAIARKLMPELARRGGLEEIEALVARCMGELLDEPRLMVRVAPDMSEAVGERLNELARSRGFDTRLIVIPDPGLPPGDCRLEWAEGGAERDSARLLAEIEHCLERLLAGG
jgi:flagellar assembly protein FliH